MSSPSLQDILAHEPGMANMIDQMSDLIPGVPASKANLTTLLEYVVKARHLRMTDSDDFSIEIVVNTYRKKKELLVSLHGKPEVWRHSLNVMGSAAMRLE